MLCDYQPHPLHFVWAFLVGGLIRTHTSLRTSLGGSANDLPAREAGRVTR